MELFVFRNYTVELFFNKFEKVEFSGYSDITKYSSSSSIYLWFYVVPIGNKSKVIQQEIENYLEKLELVLSVIPNEKTVVALTMEELFSFQYLNNDFEVKKAIYHYNINLFEKMEKYSNLKVFDFRNFTQNYSLDLLVDWKYFYLTDTIFNPKLAIFFYQWLNSKINSLLGIRKKCLIVDLDNTIWGGVLGEDGPEGIQLGGGYPGNVFKDFQKDILELSEKGIIIAVCSKNNEEDVLNFFQNHHEQILNTSHFSCMKINWYEKVANIKMIAEELNIGRDSIVFIDDNPVEQDFVRRTFPEIIVPEFPSQPYKLKLFFKNIYEAYFQVYSLTEEDKNKNLQYIENFQRKESIKNEFSMENHLSFLETQITVFKANEFNISRISQMTQKTNQFNLSTKRYSIDDIKNLIKLNYLILCIGVKDKFGDSGITGLAIIKLDLINKNAYIDSFLLSCRVLGRKIESCFLKIILNNLIDIEIFDITSNYIRSDKNIQVENFYQNHGFIETENCRIEKKYKIILGEKYIIEDYFKINVNYA